MEVISVVYTNLKRIIRVLVFRPNGLGFQREHGFNQLSLTRRRQPRAEGWDFTRA